MKRAAGGTMIHAASLLLFALAQAAPATPAADTTPTPKPTPAGPVVVLETTMGTIKIGLHKDKAPITVTNFIKYVQARHYDGTLFHRVIPNFMIQGGGLDAKMVEKVTMSPIRNEARNGLRNTRGSVAMARTNDPNSATAQFFISVKDNHSLDFGIQGAGYAVFGEVLEGMDVVDKIVSVQTTQRGNHSNVPVVPVLIKTAREVGGAAAAAPKPKASAAPKPKPSPSPK
jgi:cyclophilin family peptidyl-prolyl cis-trans isomerase